ncbi:hypothetical protein [Endozoicomonas sp. GU-1]|nr:hypothetical protein [Endozoicomonas sp. GU-1]WBA81579.1 hypothetical protein O2T12_25475 [Endozoicomonas sp. GU-1]
MLDSDGKAQVAELVGALASGAWCELNHASFCFRTFVLAKQKVEDFF